MMADEDGLAQDQLRAFIERIERMEEEKASVAADIKEIYAEAKANGFDTKIVRLIVKIRKMDPAERQEQEALLELYLSALGMIEAPPENVQESAQQQFSKTAERVVRKQRQQHDAVGFEVGDGM